MHMEISSCLVTQPVSDHNNVYFFFSNEVQTCNDIGNRDVCKKKQDCKWEGTCKSNNGGRPKGKKNGAKQSQ